MSKVSFSVHQLKTTEGEKNINNSGIPEYLEDMHRIS